MAPKLQEEQVPLWVRTATYVIAQLGFPIAVASYLLYKIGPILEQQTRLLERILWLLEKGR